MQYFYEQIVRLNGTEPDAVMEVIFDMHTTYVFVCLNVQAELIVGDQSGVIHIWDLKTDHNEQLIPELEVSVNSVHIDPDASYMAAVNSSVSILGYLFHHTGSITQATVSNIFVLILLIVVNCKSKIVPR